ncbi:MAG: carbon-nitrogen hydrolase family protein [Firmicutes bacterium]|nr:carbon-nitrogen hydrolase family protein [Bacillota bacterium]
MRKIKVAALQPLLQYTRPGEDKAAYINKQLSTTLSLLEQAGQHGCDIVTTCEDVAHVSNFGVDIDSDIFPALVELSAPIVEKALSGIAKKYNMYIVGAYIARREGQIYNVASIFDRQGKIVGEYRKTHLPVGETWQTVPGNSLDVFELDFGKVSISICYDMSFPESIQAMALKGAEIIFHPTFGYSLYDGIGEAILKVRAFDYGVYIVTAKNAVYCGAGKSSVIDTWGQVLADAGFGQNVIVSREIDLDAKTQQPDWFFNGALTAEPDASLRIRKERRPELYGEICNTDIERVRIPSEEEKLRLLADIRAGKIRWN